MASIMKRGDSYSVRYKYKDHSGKPCEGWESFKTKKEAQERKITVEKELLDGTFLVPDTMTVEEMLYKWIPIQSTKHKWSPKTYTQSVAMVQNLIVPYIGKRKVQELRTYDIEKFYAILAKTPCGQYVHGVKQDLSKKQKKRLLSSTSIHEVHTLLKTAFSYAVEWDLIHKIPLPRDAPKVNIEERTIWDEKTMLAALQTIENPALHLAVHMSMILSLREGEILGLQPSDLDFDAADGRGTISVSKTMQRANKDALEKLDPKQVYYTFPDRREGSKSSLILKKPKTKKSNRVLYMTKPLKGNFNHGLKSSNRTSRMPRRSTATTGSCSDSRMVCPSRRSCSPSGIGSGAQRTRSLSRSCSTVCGTPVPPISCCSRTATSSRCRAIQVTLRHPS